MKKLLVVSMVISVFFFSCQTPKSEPTDEPQTNGFRFAFMTDIHLTQDRDGDKGFLQAIQHLNQQHCDFVVTGGDLIMDALGVPFEIADSLYLMYTQLQDSFDVPVYNTLGNHEVFGLYEKSGVEATHPDYYKKMFKRHFAHNSYYAFMENGWCFMVLDAIGTKADGHHYYGTVDAEQQQWIKTVLDTLNAETPIVLSTHIPFFTVGTQLHKGSTFGNDSSVVVSNSKDIIEMYQNYNLKMVLQGHLHFFEDIEVNGVHYVTGGAVSARWWTGPNNGTEEGYVLVTTSGNEIEKIEYIDYGWEAKTE